jgi:putative exporter of polyketide antibiotics
MVGLDIKELQYNLRLMNKIKQFILKNKYDILTILCSGLTYFVNVWFVLGIIVFLVIGESKK